MSVYRIYVEKKPAFAVEAKGCLNDLKSALHLDALQGLRILNRYDAQGVSEEVFQQATSTVFAEPAVDVTFDALPAGGDKQHIFATEYLPGQFDQRADSCEQCIQILTQGERPVIKNARIYILTGELTAIQIEAVKAYLVNPVESREATLEAYTTLDAQYSLPTTVETLDGFIELSKEELAELINNYGLAMDIDDILFCQEYFAQTEKRNPTITEIRMIDTYWSDHCRHTTFSTVIDEIEIESDFIAEAYNEYTLIRDELYVGRNKPICLMDLATIAAKKLKKEGILKDLDESEEINACSVKINVDVDGTDEEWLLMFKNETHNHPTEIEPFGGAATCLGGAIRDPLSGRSYVYQAMRVTGCANPLTSLEDTIKGKLPQRKITVGAASGYSSYGNQIGLATGHVTEVYHEGYAAKRMEIGAVVGAAPAKNVVREVPEASDVIILLGGKTGRDGCGGATGSSKSHTLESLESCGAEVQKGNAPEERKLQRLFRNPEATTLIRRCNDFGAGGISVAIGELADGLQINLDVVPKKYDGLDGTELSISESQERMAVVVREKDADAFIALAQTENLLATKVAVVTDKNRLEMSWCGNKIVDLCRNFLNSNGAQKHTNIKISDAVVAPISTLTSTAQNWISHLSQLNTCSQKGLVERFDATIGAGTVLMPFGGKTQLTPTQSMVAKIPVLHGDTTTCSVMGWGFNPLVSSQSPFHGAIYAVIESVAKVVAVGGSASYCWLTFQEYFERTKNDPQRWGKPTAALLGAFKAQMGLGLGAIGGKDSMSGSFEELDVPPTLVSFAVSTAKSPTVISPEFKAAGNAVALILPTYDEKGLPDFESIKEVFAKVEKGIADGTILSAWTMSYGGVAEGIAKMTLGNQLGFEFTKEVSDAILFNPVYGGFILELATNTDEFDVIGVVSGEYVIKLATEAVCLETLQEAYESKLEPVFPYRIATEVGTPEAYSYAAKATDRAAPAIKIAKPKVLIPVFPGTNCEYDTARAFEKAGAEAEIFVIKNLSSKDIEASVAHMTKAIANSQIVMLPGGFSGGDEPDGSGKFITSFFRNPAIKDAVHELLNNRDGLMLGICNGFQALIKLGLVPFGEIVEMADNAPTLTFNTIARHQSMMVDTRICSNKSPWLVNTMVGDIHNVAISHGEGRFVAPAELIQALANNGQIATQYVDLGGTPTYDIRFNPNTSMMAIEGITSPDGRVLGKMAHSERMGQDICKNTHGNKDQMIFQSGVEYFTK